MKINVVYPSSREDWSDFTLCSRNHGGTLIEAIYEVAYFKQNLRLKNSFGKPDSDIWQLPWATTNANYSAQDNAIDEFAGFLNSDVFREDMTREELLTVIGMIIAHEISHAFDTTGSQYDETGMFRDWWTDTDQAAFNLRTEKLIAYYDSQYPWKDSSPYSGSIVSKEAIADLGTMACILRIAGKTEGFDYDSFFRTYSKLHAVK